MKEEDLTEVIIGLAYEVHNELGFGFLEKVYENAFVLELKKKGLQVEQQKGIEVMYKNELVGKYIADIIINNKVIVELKSVQNLDKIHEVQLVNYLKATSIEVGLLINFSKSAQVKRKILDNSSLYTDYTD